MAAEYRIEYTILRSTDDGETFEDVGFGSSGSWSCVSAALYAVESSVDNRQWETEPGMPEPDELESGGSE